MKNCPSSESERGTSAPPQPPLAKGRGASAPPCPPLFRRPCQYRLVLWAPRGLIRSAHTHTYTSSFIGLFASFHRRSLYLVSFLFYFFFSAAVPAPTERTLFNCDFEKDCQWDPQNDTVFIWHFGAKTPTFRTGPNHDHTTGSGKMFNYCEQVYALYIYDLDYKYNLPIILKTITALGTLLSNKMTMMVMMAMIHTFYTCRQNEEKDLQQFQITFYLLIC